MEAYEDEEDVAFVVVQTAFEGFHKNNERGMKETAERYDLEIPVGHSGSEKKRSELMRTYKTGGTPWTVIIGKSGRVRFNDFRIEADDAEDLIDKLLEEE